MNFTLLRNFSLHLFHEAFRYVPGLFPIISFGIAIDHVVAAQLFGCKSLWRSGGYGLWLLLLLLLLGRKFSAIAPISELKLADELHIMQQLNYPEMIVKPSTKLA